MRTEVIPMEQLMQLLEVQLEQGIAPLRVVGCSMSPTFESNRDTVYLQKAQTLLRKGDVILYRRKSGQYVLHRIVQIRNDHLILSGDNQHEPEDVDPEQVIARVESFQRKGKNYSVTHPGYRLWVWLWVGLFPVRRPLIALRRRLGCLRRALKRTQRSGGMNHE